MNTWLQEWIYHLLPGICLLCGVKTYRRLDLCHYCESDLPWLKHSCIRCALPLPQHQSICGKCQTNSPAWNRLFCPFTYAPPVDYLIHQLKYRHNLVAGQVMGSLLAMHIKLQSGSNAPLPQFIVPVPLHRNRLKERGYNQAVELANVISDLLQIPVDTRVCRRIKDTPAQQFLSRSERKTNIKGAFSLEKSVSGCHVALVDDVMTTGSTVTEICQLLLEAGTQTIDVFSVARTDQSWINQNL